MELNESNYYSTESNIAYMSNSQYQSFLKCENSAMGRLEGLYKEEESEAMLQGSYVDAWNEGTLEQFISKHPEIFSSRGQTAGELKAGYKKCNDIIELLKEDPMLSTALSGEKQKIFTAKLFGIDWKCKVDSYFPRDTETNGRIVDLKVLKSLYDKFWNEDVNAYENVFEYRGYFDQVSLYSKIEQIASGRPDKDYYEPYLAIVTKEEPSDRAVISFSSIDIDYKDFIDSRLLMIEKKIPRIIEVKAGRIPPIRCEKCEYCRQTKTLSNTTHFSYFNIY